MEVGRRCCLRGSEVLLLSRKLLLPVLMGMGWVRLHIGCTSAQKQKRLDASPNHTPNLGKEFFAFFLVTFLPSHLHWNWPTGRMLCPTFNDTLRPYITMSCMCVVKGEKLGVLLDRWQL